MTKIKILDPEHKEICEPLTKEALSDLFKQMQSSQSAVGVPHSADFGFAGMILDSEVREDGVRIIKEFDLREISIIPNKK